jgi:hypothetical protein
MQLAVTGSSIAQCLKQYLASRTLPFLLTYVRKNEQTGFLGASTHKSQTCMQWREKHRETHKSQTHTNEKLDTMADEEIERVLYNGWF